jgi:DNA-binding SARP family transcriptional activator
VPGTTEFLLLGPLVVRRDGAVVPVPPGKQRVLLAALLLRAGRLTGLDELTEMLWEARPPVSARASLQTYVARLRRTLGDAGQAIRTEPGGYLIEIGPDELDVARFEAAVAAGRDAAAAGAWAQAAAVLRAGLALWRGEALAGVPSEALAASAAPRLAELRQQAVEARIDADLNLGRHAEVLAELRQLAARDPLRERWHALLMLALYQDGQQAAALAAYHAARAVLVDELGAEPGPELRRLQQRVLAGDPAPRPAGPGPATTGEEVRYALPPDTAAFTGRDAELDRITAAVTGLGGAGVVAIGAIDGMPGIGKTALAVHAAHRLRDRFPDRQLFIDLHGHTPGRDPMDPAEALAGLLAATGLDPRALPADLAGRATLWRHRLASERVLLVLDNAASSAQVSPLLPGGDGGLVLVTSRRHLADLPGAVTPLLLDTLPPDQAADMVIRLAPRAAGAPPQAVAELARLARFLPLALALLARVFNRHPAWSVADLAAETRASLLTLTGERDSVAAAFEVSYQHLDPGQRDFFRRLGLHPGTTIDACAGAALGGVPLTEARRLLDVLHGEGLLTETGYRRYGMHDLIRRYAAERSAAEPAAEREQATGRLLDYYQHTAARAEARLARQPQARPPRPAAPPAASPAAVPDLPDRTGALAWARAERANLLACLDHATRLGAHARVVGLTAAMAAVLRHDGPWADAIARHTAAAAAARRVGDRAGQAGALNNLGIIRRLTGDYPGAARDLAEALDLFRDLGDRLGRANALVNLAAGRVHTGDYPAAAAVLAEALGTYRDLGAGPGQADALSGLAHVRYMMSDYPAAERYFGEALDLVRSLGDVPGQIAILLRLGAMRRRTGEYLAAAAALEAALDTSRDFGDRLGQASALNGLGAIRRLSGDAAGAASALTEALSRYRELGSRLGQANALTGLGIVFREAGDLAAAGRAHEEALAILGDLGDRGGRAELLNELGTLHRLRGDLGAARDCYGEALHLAREIASALDEAGALAGLGHCALAEGDTAAGAAGLRAALAIFERIGAAEAAGVAAELDALIERAGRPAGSGCGSGWPAS